MWRKRREERDKVDAGAAKKATFTKLDLTALIVSKQLRSKDAVLTYVQQHGSAAMQAYVSRVQRKLGEHIQDAEEWAGAPASAASEEHTDWELLCQAAAKPCPCGDSDAACPYWEATKNIFAHNCETVCPRKLARALRNVLIAGPSKQNRVPFLVGPSNSGKSTLLYPFDDLFSVKKVLHKPALGSTFGLRNITKKRFIFWDDYRPVEYAHEKTIPVSLFLSLFIGQPTEIQVSQAFNDGNVDVEWKRGVAFTAKVDGLWEPTKRVGEEDIRHMRNRVEEFHFTHVMQQGALKEIAPCVVHMAKWILQESDASDAGGALRPVLPTSHGEGLEVADRQIAGFQELVQSAQLPTHSVRTLQIDLEGLGAMDVKELTVADWETLPSWGALRMLEKRRVMQRMFGPRVQWGTPV